ncbi:MAG TPA: hypothetical protein VFG79_13040, partial [Solirubrobacter sp.]|nr:hypothetical protein [Solirubrobacter sp.]
AGASVTIAAKTPQASRKVETMNRLFDLENVWSDALPDHEGEMFAVLEAGVPTPASVGAILDRVVVAGSRPVEQLQHGMYLRARYADYLKRERLDSVVTDWTKKRRELEGMGVDASSTPPA